MRGSEWAEDAFNPFANDAISICCDKVRRHPLDDFFGLRNIGLPFGNAARFRERRESPAQIGAGRFVSVAPASGHAAARKPQNGAIFG